MKLLESIHHALLHCEFASRVWNFWANGLQLIQMNAWIFSDLALFILSHKSLQDLELFFTVAWAIWYNRNKSIYEGICSSPCRFGRWPLVLLMTSLLQPL